MDFQNGVLAEKWIPASKFLAMYDPEVPEIKAARAALATVGVKDLAIRRISLDPDRRLHLDLGGNKSFTDLAALRGLPVEELSLEKTPITDISALRGAPLKYLYLRGCKKLTDLSPILSLTRLERLSCDVLPKELLPLRQSATLQSIEAAVYPGEGAKGPRPVADFWAAYDAHQAAAKK